MVQFKYQKSQSLIATIDGSETVVIVETPYISGERPRYETKEGHDFSEDELQVTSERIIPMTLEAAERFADLQSKHKVIEALWEVEFADDKYSNTCIVLEETKNILMDEIKKQIGFYAPR